MCSIAMPGELLLGHSPPVYNHLLYNPLMVTAAKSPIAGRSVPPRIRPCLSTGSLPICGLHNTIANDNKQKKRVVFADARGLSLTHVRVMSEPSNMPPLWANTYLAGVTSGLKAEAVSSPWETSFQQPASDYLAFRQKLEQQAVSLENVIIREAEQCLIGTVKVKNLAYDKEVIVRASSDEWATQEDVHCSYVEQPGNGLQAALNLYDTFRFKLTLPVKYNKIEFCVCYRTNDKEYWDNNEKTNYIVQKRKKPRLPIRSKTTGNHIDTSSPCRNDNVIKLADATRANLRTWSEFASWQHLNNDAPYW
ncbi:hypothetical protein PV325_006123 [Microctonus aethiopoides]|uniref:Protein phosphatase 1 regulatory subunit n=1 Tax=Microctonus aethiopoides TaxID=144406 RepID=A0AA39C742_9HYME|nr:hypothetical protein PV325_006123 [Microctonus aethiopoides]KAK0099060.1 hypothetical protein PV326_008374 [Microctonus aethiopoides]KAK0159146.1 hypothetical protein PV328_010068 [Microctonus aethiopoides]